MARGDAGDAMAVGEAVIVAGIGCRKGATVDEVEAAIEAALKAAGRAPEALSLIATSDGKGGEPGIVAASLARGVPLVLVGPADLEAAGTRTQSSSPRVLALTGVPSVAEAAALAAAGPTARLLLPRIVVGPVTCAFATTDNTP
jgi:cobalt-precorrin 5A hydrolase